MRKFFLAALVWELIRFSLVVMSAQKKTGSEMILWLASQQLVLFYLYFFLWYNTDRFCHFMKAAAAGKFMGLAAGILFLTGLVTGTSSTASVFFTLNILLVDAASLVFLLFLIRKYFSNLLRD